MEIAIQETGNKENLTDSEHINLLMAQNMKDIIKKVLNMEKDVI
jgi:hypothetical protein